MKLVSSGRLAELLGISAHTVRSRYKLLGSFDERGHMVFDQPAVDLIVDQIKESEEASETYVVPAKEAAATVGLHVKTFLERYREFGRNLGVKGYHFKNETVAEILLQEKTPFAAHFTVSRQEAAKRLGCAPETLSRGLLKGLGRRFGRELRFREADVEAAERQRTNTKWYGRTEIVALLGIKEGQFHYLFDYVTTTIGLRRFEFASWRTDLSDEQKPPFPGKWTKTGPMWQGYYILPWCVAFKESPERFLSPQGLLDFLIYADFKNLPRPLKANVNRISFLEAEAEFGDLRTGSIDEAKERILDNLPK